MLDCFAVHPELGGTQVARELGVAKSTACRMLSALAVLLATPSSRATWVAPSS